MSYSLHPEAEEDIADVMDFYMEQAGTLVAQRFLDEFERAINFIVENPEIGTPYARNRKVYHLRGFPYSVIYRDIESEILVFVVRHQRRKPNFGNKRR